MPKLFGRNTEEDEDPGKAVEAKFGELNTKFDTLSSTTVTKEEFKKTQDSVEFIATELKNAKKEKADREAAARNKAETEGKTYDPEEAFNEFAADPRKAFNNATAKAERIAAIALGRQTRAEVLGSKEYYHGEFKTKVDNMIDTGTTDVNALSNPSYILNCYKLVMAEYMENGKLDEMKRAAAAHSFSDGQGTGKPGEEDKTVKIDFRGQQNYSASKAKFAMEQMGLTDEDVTKAAKEGSINGLEVMA